MDWLKIIFALFPINVGSHCSALLCMKLLFFKIFVRVSDSRDAGQD